MNNRVHLDVAVDDLDVAATAAEALGAGRVGAPVPDPAGGFQVMLDSGGQRVLLHRRPTLVEASGATADVSGPSFSCRLVATCRAAHP
jgi:hypothetical protein